MKLYTWTHMLAPDDMDSWGDKPWMRQTSCAVVLKTDKEFRERFHYNLSSFKGYVQVEKLGEREHDGLRLLAIENPGVVYGQDIWNHGYGERVYIPLRGASNQDTRDS